MKIAMAIICVGALAIISVLAAWPVNNNLTRPHVEPDGPAETVRAFWRAAEAGDEAALLNLYIGWPASFSDKMPRCNGQSKQPDLSTLKEGEALVVAPAFSDWPEWKKLYLQQASFLNQDIKERKVQWFQAVKVTEFENEAVYRMTYRENNLIWSEFVLLYKTSDGWKIFMIDKAYGMFNPNYAKEDCGAAANTGKAE